MSDPMRRAGQAKKSSRWLQAVLALLVVLLAAAMVFGLKQCGGSTKRTVPAKMVLKVVPTPPPPPPPPPPPEPEVKPEPEQIDEPEPAPADAPVADAPAGDALPFGEGGMSVDGAARSGTGFGRPQDYLRQEIEKCLRKTPALQKVRIKPQRFVLDVGADRRIARVARQTSTGREDLDQQLDARVQECVGTMPPDSRYVANSRFAIEISKQ